jgi:hypothetical protein
MLAAMSRGKLYGAVALLAASLVYAGVAVAAPPANLQIGESGGRITATWGEPGLFDIPLAAEIAQSPKTGADGSFSDPGKTRDALGEIDTSWTSRVLANGIWYVHIGAYELGEKCGVDDEGNLTCPTDWSPVYTVRIGPGSGPSVRDTIIDFRSLRVAKRQKAAKLRVLASMAEKGSITVRGAVKVGGKGFNLRPVTASCQANRTVTLRVKLSKKAMAAVGGALSRGRKVRANLTILARDAAGNRKSAKRSVTLKR